MNILSVEHLTKVYGSGDTAVTALDDVSFSVEAGEFVAIIGSSGSGKSTLLHLMGGVERPTSGTVRLQGQDVFARTDEELAVFRRREVGLVYQFYNLIPVLDVVENITLPVLMDGREVNLTETEYGILRLLMQDPERIYPAQTLYEAVWNEPYYYTSNGTVMVHIRNLRLKIEEDPQNPRRVCTVWGKGYHFARGGGDG